ncbi:hypothetical protein ACUN9Y_03045 [Halomonas sp. V046]|uniref:hypothetical protein n=1 Tax=Halomonas sp. V046 TaxID=3459611 RepID=UPI004043F815
MARRRTANFGTPVGYWMMGMNLTRMMVETQMVIAMRLMGMQGAWSVAPNENVRMVSEKMTAFAQSMMATQRAVISGKSPDQVLGAAMRPLSRKTASNHRRLGRAGPK